MLECIKAFLVSAAIIKLTPELFSEHLLAFWGGSQVNQLHFASLYFPLLLVLCSSCSCWFYAHILCFVGLPLTWFCFRYCPWAFCIDTLIALSVSMVRFGKIPKLCWFCWHFPESCMICIKTIKKTHAYGFYCLQLLY